MGPYDRIAMVGYYQAIVAREELSFKDCRIWIHSHTTVTELPGYQHSADQQFKEWNNHSEKQVGKLGQDKCMVTP